MGAELSWASRGCRSGGGSAPAPPPVPASLLGERGAGDGGGDGDGDTKTGRWGWCRAGEGGLGLVNTPFPAGELLGEGLFLLCQTKRET